MTLDGIFKIFDSHAKDVYAIPDLFGRCVLINLQCLNSVSEYFQSIYIQSCTHPFEVKGVKLLNLNDTLAIDGHNFVCQANCMKSGSLDARETCFKKRWEQC